MISSLKRPFSNISLSLTRRMNPRKDESALQVPLRVSLTLLSIYHLHVSTM